MSTFLFESLFSEPEITAVAVEGIASKSKNEALPSQVLDKALEIAKISGDAVRVLVGMFTITVHRTDHGLVATAVPTGAPIAKSLPRMVRRRSVKASKPAKSAAPAVTTASKPVETKPTRNEPEKVAPAPATGVRSW